MPIDESLATVIDVPNDQFVGMAGDHVIVMRPKQRMTKREALVHAAWLVALAEDEPGEFARILEAVRNT